MILYNREKPSDYSLCNCDIYKGKEKNFEAWKNKGDLDEREEALHEKN